MLLETGSMALTWHRSGRVRKGKVQARLIGERVEVVLNDWGFGGEVVAAD